MIPRGDGWREGCRPHPGPLAYPLCHCGCSGAIPSPEQRRLVDVCSTSSRRPRHYALRSKKVDTHEHPGPLKDPSCHCERSAAISSPEQRRFVDVCSTSSRLPRRYALRSKKVDTHEHTGPLTPRERGFWSSPPGQRGWNKRDGLENDAKGAVVGQRLLIKRGAFVAQAQCPVDAAHPHIVAAHVGR